MKKTIVKALAFVACAITMASCTEEMKWKDSSVTAPSGLFAPEDNKSVTLQASATAALVFEWGSSSAEDGGAPQYEVAFDLSGGDFSNPIYRVAADLNGSLPKATISHKILNSVAGIAGAASGQSASVKWTVFAYRGLTKVKASEEKTLNLTRFYGFDELPGSLYVIGSDEGSGVACGAPANGEFEVCVKLKSGQGFTLNSAADGSGTSYCINGDKLAEGNTGYTVSEDGVYRMYFDFNVASVVSIRKVAKVCLYFCPNDDEPIEMPYIGGGIFQGTGWMEFKQEGWGRDERYKFHMYYADGSLQVWGTKNDTDGRPGGLPMTDPYYYIAETPNNQWDQKWKFDTEYDGANVKLSLIFNVANYTHHVEHAD